MTRKANPRPQRLLLWMIVAIAVALILLRLFVFVSHVRSGHRRHGEVNPAALQWNGGAHRQAGKMSEDPLARRAGEPYPSPKRSLTVLRSAATC